MAQNHFLTPLDKQRERVTITVRNAYILYPNFAGKPTKFNPQGGVRGFNIMMNEADGLHLMANGWTSVAKMKKHPEDDDPNVYYKLPVTARFDNYPPRIWLLESQTPEQLEQGIPNPNRVLLDEDVVDYLDRLEFSKIDMVISGSQWRNPAGQSGRKAYLQSAFFTLYVDELEREYGVVKGIGDMGMQKALPAGEDAGARQSYDYDGEEVPFDR